MSIFTAALPEFLGGLSAAGTVAALRWAALRLRARRATRAKRRALPATPTRRDAEAGT